MTQGGGRHGCERVHGGAAAADAVVGKIGYRTLAETCRSRVPYGFVPRPGFRESAVRARRHD